MNIQIPPNKPYSESCDQNRDHILAVIQPLLSQSNSVLEVGSGTGQHAVYFAKQLPDLVWHTSDCREYMAGIGMWIEDAGLENARNPIELNVSDSAWPTDHYDAIFTANSVHIMHWDNVEALFRGAGTLLPVAGQFIIYGPFNYDNQYTREQSTV